MQVDLHTAELTVRETFDFAARVQGTKLKAGENIVNYSAISLQCACAGSRSQHSPLVVCPEAWPYRLRGWRLRNACDMCCPYQSQLSTSSFEGVQSPPVHTHASNIGL